MSGLRTVLASRRWLLTTALVAALAHGCALAPRSARDERVRILELHNQHWEDVAVYLDRGHTLIRVGTVPGLQSRNFKLNPAQVGSGSELKLVAELRVSGARHASRPFSVAPGQRIGWVIGHRLGLSSLVIR